MRPVGLSLRLLALAEQVPSGCRFADIGTDHARLPVWLLEHGRISAAIACDLREGPLLQARRTAERHRLTGRISFRLGDGLEPVGPNDEDVIAIAGMGGETIVEILSAAPWTREEGCLLLLQPMTSVPELRRWLCRSGYTIVREQLVKEDKLYVVLSAVGGEMRPLTPAEEWGGRQQVGEFDPLRGEYLEALLMRAEQALMGLKKSGEAGDRAAAAQWADLAAGLKSLKEEWETWQR